MKKYVKSVLDELVASFKYYKESKKGKYSLDTYLDIIGTYTDKIIVQSELESLEFTGGVCCVKNNTLDSTYVFSIKMYFKNSEGKSILKEATRCLDKRRFISETEKEILDEKSFEINKPE